MEEVVLDSPEVVTVTSTMPASCGGELTVMRDPVRLTENVVVETLPKFTVVAPENPVPVMVTRVPPDVAPLYGKSPETVGFPS